MGERGFLGATRRTVLAGFAAALAQGPLAAQAQSRGGMHRLGVLMSDPSLLAGADEVIE